MIGVPVQTKALSGVDSLYSILQMPKGYPFVREQADKGKLSQIVNKLAEEYPKVETAATLDRIKNAGFYWATRSGVTVALSDILTPPNKAEIVAGYEKQAADIVVDCTGSPSGVPTAARSPGPYVSGRKHLAGVPPEQQRLARRSLREDVDGRRGLLQPVGQINRVAHRCELAGQPNLAQQHRAGIEALLHLHHHHAGLPVAGHDRPLDGRSTPPARQQRGMAVPGAEPRSLEHRLRQQQPVERAERRRAAVEPVFAQTGTTRVVGTVKDEKNAISLPGVPVARCPAVTDLATRCLFLPDYFNYLLCGRMENELTVASTSQLPGASMHWAFSSRRMSCESGFS